MSDIIIPDGFGHLAFSLTHAGISHTAQVTCGFRVATEPFDQNDNDECLDSFADAFAGRYDNEVTFSRLVTLVNFDGTMLRFESLGAAVGTAGAAEIAPPQVSYVVRKTTNLSGRAFRGRMFFPFVAEANVKQEGTLPAATITAWQAALDAWVADITAGGEENVSDLVLLHSTPLVGSAPVPTDILSLVMTGMVGTQRRRLER